MTAKWSVKLLIEEQLGTLVNERTRKYQPSDFFFFFAVPIAAGAFSYFGHFRFQSVDGILTGVSIFTGLLFALVIHVFTLGLRITDDPRIASESKTSRLIDQLQANVLYAVLVGISSTIALSIASGTTDTKYRVGRIMTAVLVLMLAHLVMTILMILKRMRSAYHEFRR